MSDSPSENSQPVSQPVLHPRPVVWLLGAVLGTALFAALAAHLPDRAKLLGLFPLIWGAAAGVGLSWWATECRLKMSPAILMVSWLIVATGEAGIVLEAWRVHRSELQRQFSKDPSSGFIAQAKKSEVTSDKPEEVAMQNQFLAELDRVRQSRKQSLSLTAFLYRRLKKLGDLPQPWPEIFWGGEILLGGLCAVGIMRRQGSTSTLPSTAANCDEIHSQ